MQLSVIFPALACLGLLASTNERPAMRESVDTLITGGTVIGDARPH